MFQPIRNKISAQANNLTGQVCWQLGKDSARELASLCLGESFIWIRNASRSCHGSSPESVPDVISLSISLITDLHLFPVYPQSAPCAHNAHHSWAWSFSFTCSSERVFCLTLFRDQLVITSEMKHLQYAGDMLLLENNQWGPATRKKQTYCFPFRAIQRRENSFFFFFFHWLTMTYFLSI